MENSQGLGFCSHIRSLAKNSWKDLFKINRRKWFGFGFASFMFFYYASTTFIQSSAFKNEFEVNKKDSSYWMNISTRKSTRQFLDYFAFFYFQLFMFFISVLLYAVAVLYLILYRIMLEVCGGLLKSGYICGVWLNCAVDLFTSSLFPVFCTVASIYMVDRTGYWVGGLTIASLGCVMVILNSKEDGGLCDTFTANMVNIVVNDVSDKRSKMKYWFIVSSVPALRILAVCIAKTFAHYFKTGEKEVQELRTDWVLERTDELFQRNAYWQLGGRGGGGPRSEIELMGY